MRTLRLTIAYEGTDFSGWQWQPDRRTVQGVIEAAVKRVTGESLRVVASGRTDAGVHALGQVASLSIDSSLSAPTLARAWNANLPRDVTILDVAEALPGFHAIEHAVAKQYRYVIQDGPTQDIFSRRYAWHVRHSLDAAAMHQSAESLLGTHDFRTFESAGSPRVSSVRTIRSFTVQRKEYQDGERLLLEVEADGFLYNMVRNLTGTLVEVGKQKRPVIWPSQILGKRDRCLAGMTAPPQGLYLVRVDLRSNEADFPATPHRER